MFFPLPPHAMCFGCEHATKDDPLYAFGIIFSPPLGLKRVHANNQDINQKRNVFAMTQLEMTTEKKHVAYYWILCFILMNSVKLVVGGPLLRH